MHFQFKYQEYQARAVRSVAEVFRGQPWRGAVRTAPAREEGEQLVLYEEAAEPRRRSGRRNAPLELTPGELLENIRAVQSAGDLRPSQRLVGDLGACCLDVEMETGTGKTFVYIQTMFELHRRYGWNKFVVVVPSVAIREGVYKTFQMTGDYFQREYGQRARFFIYHSQDLAPLDQFCTDSGVNVMIITMQAFNARGAESRRIYEKLDNFGGRVPIEVIRACHPILILDEPQKMGGDKTHQALKEFAPLFALHYSATHREQHNLVYVLDALDAYRERLVKKIQVKGIEVRNFRGTDQYLYLEGIELSPRRGPMARLEIEIARKGSGPRRDLRLVGEGDDLFRISKEMEQYRGYRVSRIDPVQGEVRFVNGRTIRCGELTGDVSERDMRRVQIRETILSHFEKEQQLFPLGIKTLSLFFVDEVAKYRQYDDQGNELLGEYGEIFEQEYLSVLNDYITLEDSPYVRYLKGIPPDKTHAGYFSIDKKGRMVNSSVRRSSGESDDVSAYDLILRNKERLLSFEEPVRFIFSHSALREGWDNPNVFQICSLRHGDSQTQKRQEVGRGLRLCVDQAGERMDEERCGRDRVHEINKLTVIAGESYAQFVDQLQKQIKEVLYDRPVRADVDFFRGRTVGVGAERVTLDERQARMIYQYLVRSFYVDAEDKITDDYRRDRDNGALAPLPPELSHLTQAVHRLIASLFDERELDGMVENGNGAAVRDNPLNENFLLPEFQTLWEQIRRRYTYSVELDSGELIRRAAAHIDDKLFVTELKYTTTRGVQREDLARGAIERGEGFRVERSATHTLHHREQSAVRYDLVGRIAQGAKLTRRTAAEILMAIRWDKFQCFALNPEEFLTKVVNLIQEEKARLIVERVRYHPTGQSWEESIFTAGQGKRDLTRAVAGKKSVQPYVFLDSTSPDSVEMRFFRRLEEDDAVLAYAKLPRQYTIPTPVGDYSPDWAIAFRDGAVRYVRFLAETKGSLSTMDQRPVERAKIECAKRLFNEDAGGDVRFHDVTSYEEMLDLMDKLP